MQLNPFTAFCLYVSARVCIKYLKSRPNDYTVKTTLQFLLSALNALKPFSTLTESFLMQLDVDLAGRDLGISNICQRGLDDVRSHPSHSLSHTYLMLTCAVGQHPSTTSKGIPRCTRSEYSGSSRQ